MTLPTKIAKHRATRKPITVLLPKDAADALARGRREHFTITKAVSHALVQTYKPKK